MGSETHTQRELGRDLEGTLIVADGHRDTQRKTEIGGIHRNGFREGGETKTQSHIVMQRAGSQETKRKECGETWGETQVVMEWQWSNPPTTLSLLEQHQPPSLRSIPLMRSSQEEGGIVFLEE